MSNPGIKIPVMSQRATVFYLLREFLEFFSQLEYSLHKAGLPAQRYLRSFFLSGAQIFAQPDRISFGTCIYS